ncbi:MAG: GNAT family N-acetyltransferase [Acidothermales bacterium]|nr:GNAT family N-acetyltransferase [Acidothermales bacterium]
MQVIRVDARDDEAFARWYAASAEGASAGRTDPPIWMLAETRVFYRESGPDAAHLCEAYAAVGGDELVGAGYLEVPMHDNPRYALVGVDVPPRHRERGAGAGLYARLVERAAEPGPNPMIRSTFQSTSASAVPSRSRRKVM